MSTVIRELWDAEMAIHALEKRVDELEDRRARPPLPFGEVELRAYTGDRMLTARVSLPETERDPGVIATALERHLLRALAAIQREVATAASAPPPPPALPDGQCGEWPDSPHPREAACEGYCAPAPAQTEQPIIVSESGSGAAVVAHLCRAVGTEPSAMTEEPHSPAASTPPALPSARLDIRPPCIRCGEKWMPPEGVDAQEVACCALPSAQPETERAHYVVEWNRDNKWRSSSDLVRIEGETRTVVWNDAMEPEDAILTRDMRPLVDELNRLAGWPPHKPDCRWLNGGGPCSCGALPSTPQMERVQCEKCRGEGWDEDALSNCVACDGTGGLSVPVKEPGHGR